MSRWPREPCPLVLAKPRPGVTTRLRSLRVRSSGAATRERLLSGLLVMAPAEHRGALAQRFEVLAQRRQQLESRKQYFCALGAPRSTQVEAWAHLKLRRTSHQTFAALRRKGPMSRSSHGVQT